MHEDVKLCPECGAEYFAHVNECRGCGVELKHPEEIEKQGFVPESNPDAQLVCIDMGSYHKEAELAGVLKGLGVEEAQVLKAGSGGGCSSDGYGLFVPQDVAEKSARAVEEYWLKLHPEIKEAEDQMAEGRCPACGAECGSYTECPECGLFLGSSDGGPPGGGTPEGGDCGPCGPC